MDETTKDTSSKCEIGIHYFTWHIGGENGTVTTKEIIEHLEMLHERRLRMGGNIEVWLL